MYIQMEDHRGEDGNIDWTSYKKAQKANGEYCDKCGSHIMFGGKGYPVTCHSCKDLYSASSVSHNSFVRCPKCSFNFSPFQSENYELMAEGEHSVYCIECDHCFEVETSIQYTFRSPDLLKEDCVEKVCENKCKRCGAIEGKSDPNKHGSAKWMDGICWHCY